MPVQDDTLLRMHSTAEHWKQAGDNRHVFLTCYALMTDNMLRAIEDDCFHDRIWVSGLLHHFADYYFFALRRFDANDPTAPPVWVHAHRMTCEHRLLPVQYLLLGINAHINYDLVLSLVDFLLPEWEQLTPQQLEQRHRDHTTVNDVIARTIDAVQDTVLEPLSPWMDIIDRAFGRLDEWLLSNLIRSWREEVWQEALHFVQAATPEKRETLRRQREARVMERGEKLAFHL